MNRPAEITVRQVMTPAPFSLEPERPVQDALDRMNQHRVGAVLVVEGEKLVGIFTERDFLRRAATASPGWRSTRIGDWMSPHPYTIHPDTGWEQAVTSLERLRVRHLPVVENGKVIGIVSARQLIGKRAEYLKATVELRTRELKLANEHLMARDSEISHSMKAAARLQHQVVLPHAPPDWPEISLGVHFSPLDPLGGDYYDFARPDDDHLGILIADASGHGIPAAMVAIMTRFAFMEIASHSFSPGEVLTSLNNRLQELTDERFVTAFYGILDRRSLRFTYANAGHPFPYHFSARQQTIQPLAARGFILGISPQEVYREKCLELEPHDRLCLFTDGIPDTRDAIGESFGTDRLRDCLPSLPESAEAPAWTDSLMRHLADFRGGQKPIDDMTLIVAKVRG